MRFIFSSPDRPEIIEGMCRWAGARIGESYDPEHTNGISVLCEHGAATVLYTDYEKALNCRMHVAGAGNWLSRTALSVFFSYPFEELGLRRITTLVEKKNRRARKLNEGLGFVREGCLRKGARNGDNLIVYGMLKDECRWLKERGDGGQKFEAA